MGPRSSRGRGAAAGARRGSSWDRSSRGPIFAGPPRGATGPRAGFGRVRRRREEARPHQAALLGRRGHGQALSVVSWRRVPGARVVRARVRLFGQETRRRAGPRRLAPRGHPRPRARAPEAAVRSPRGSSFDASRRRRGGAAAATWLFLWCIAAAPRPRRGYFSGASRRRRGRDVAISLVHRGGAATGGYVSGASRRRRDRWIYLWCIAATPRPRRGYLEETSLRYCAVGVFEAPLTDIASPHEGPVDWVLKKLHAPSGAVLLAR